MPNHHPYDFRWMRTNRSIDPTETFLMLPLLLPAMQKEFSIREEANAITCFAFRNGFLEDLHAGDWSELLDDRKLSRITDTEMKQLMIESSRRVARLLQMKQDDPSEYWKLIAWQTRAYTNRWDKDADFNDAIET